VQLRSILHFFYEAAALPETWPLALDQLAAAFNAKGSVLLSRPFRAGEIICSTQFDAHIDEFFSSNGASNELRSDGASTRPAASAEGKTYDFSIADLSTSARYRDIAAKADIRWSATASLDYGDGKAFVLSLFRSAAQGPFSESDLRQLSALRPHLRDSIDLARRLGIRTGNALLDTLEAQGTGAILLGETGRILGANAIVDLVLGAEINLSNGSITVESSAVSLQIAEEIKSALLPRASPKPRSILVTTSSGAPYAALRVIPLVGNARDIFHAGRAVILLRRLGHHEVSIAAPLMSIFGLTAAEARVVEHLADGKDVTEIGEYSNVSVQTVRTQLKSIFSKTGTNRQTALLELVEQLRSISFEKY
jgi:DNA-binding CsgD family transcriptional regulator